MRGSSVEWSLNPIVCKTIFNRLQRPLIDLFATSQNAQLPTFCSWTQDPMAYAQDAMSISWNFTIAYAFPSIALIPRVLEKLATSKNCEILLIAPNWPRQTWFPRLLTLLAGEVIALLFLKTLQTLNLTVWPISSSPTRRRAFQTKLQPSLERQGERRPDQLIMPISRSSRTGARLPGLIQIQQL